METVLKKREKSRPSIPIRIEAVFDEKEDILAFMYKTYADNLYAYGLSFHSDIGTIEDAIHDVFIDIYTNEKRLAHISNLRQYLIAAFRHRLLFLLQDNKRYVRMLNDTFDAFVEENSQEKWIEKEEENEKKKKVKQLLSRLTQHQREAVHLRFIEGFSYDEIAEIMQINYLSVKTLIHRSMFRIRNKYVPSSPNVDSDKK